MWLQCDPYCRRIGRSGGRNGISKSTCPFVDRAWSCHCYGSYGPKQKGVDFEWLKLILKIILEFLNESEYIFFIKMHSIKQIQNSPFLVF